MDLNTSPKVELQDKNISTPVLRRSRKKILIPILNSLECEQMSRKKLSGEGLLGDQ